MMRIRRGQTILEYTIIIGIVTVVLFYMGTGIKRGVQSLVKITADQVGNQQNSDQNFNDQRQGYMDCSTTEMNEFNNKQTAAIGYIPKGSQNAIEITNISVNEFTNTTTNTITNAGFTQSAQ